LRGNPVFQEMRAEIWDLIRNAPAAAREAAVGGSDD